VCFVGGKERCRAKDALLVEVYDGKKVVKSREYEHDAKAIAIARG
jgi:hypothetical protein